jgi:hypothetical protein
MTPVIILAFANDKDAYLQMIVRESKSIYNTLLNHNDKGFIKLYREENTSIKDIFNYFYRYNDEIFIFHYGGHASGTHLQLETMMGDSQMADARGLAQLMGRQQELRLVFLNGCATQRQVALLHDAGVRAVIATSVPIEDKSATEFARQFYQSLANRFTIKEAFSNARDFMVTTYGTTRQIKEYRYRDLNWKKMKKNIKTEAAWGLYVHEDHEKVLDWKLPTSSRDTVSISTFATLYARGAQVNTKMMETLFNEASRCSDELGRLSRDFKNNQIDLRKIRTETIDIFPTPIGAHLQSLFQDSSKNDIERLQQLFTAYQTAVEFVCFTMLSELWDATFKNPATFINENYLARLQRFFDLNDENYQAFSYVELIEAITKIFHENKTGFFVEELNTLKESFTARDEFYHALLFMEDMKNKLIREDIKISEVENSCIQAEERLGVILKKLVPFCVKYKLTTIKNIKIIKYKHKDPRYLHNRIMLDRFSEGTLDEEKAWEFYTDSNSVILLKNADDVSQYMSLSPFVIDKTALFPDWEKSQLYFFSCKNKAGNRCYYKFSGKEENKPLVLSEEEYPQIYPVIKDQFAECKKNVLNLKFKDESTMGVHHGKV